MNCDLSPFVYEAFRTDIPVTLCESASWLIFSLNEFYIHTLTQLGEISIWLTRDYLIFLYIKIKVVIIGIWNKNPNINPNISIILKLLLPD